jgi:hypothetical protein
MNRLHLRLLALALALTPIAAAQSLYSSSKIISSNTPSAGVMSDAVVPFSTAAVSGTFGFGGGGFELATPLAPRLNLRGGASFFSYHTALLIDGATIAGAIKLQNSSVMVDFFPFHNRLRVSTGLTVFDDTRFDASLSVPAGTTFTLGGIDYTSDPKNPISGAATFRFGDKVAPRFTFGFGNMLSKNGHLALETETGFQYISAPVITYHITGNGCTGPNYTNCSPVPQTSISEQQTNLQNDLSGLRFFPIASIGVSYKFGSTR